MDKTILAVTVIALSAICMMEAREARFWMFGSGSGRDRDKSMAISQASDVAAQHISALCRLGNVTDIERIQATCSGGEGGTPYACLVSARGMCELYVRHGH